MCLCLCLQYGAFVKYCDIVYTSTLILRDTPRNLCCFFFFCFSFSSLLFPFSIHPLEQSPCGFDSVGCISFWWCFPFHLDQQKKLIRGVCVPHWIWIFVNALNVTTLFPFRCSQFEIQKSLDYIYIICIDLNKLCQRKRNEQRKNGILLFFAHFFQTNLKTRHCVKTKCKIEIYERENWKWSEAYRVVRMKKVSRTEDVCILSDIQHKHSISISFSIFFF